MWLWKRLTDCLRYCYFHYTLITSVAFLDPSERHCFNAFLFVFISLFLYTSVVYMPGHLTMMCNFLMHVSGIRPYPTTGPEEFSS